MQTQLLFGLFATIPVLCPFFRGRSGVIRECQENATGRMYMAKIIPYSPKTKQDVLKEYEILKSLHNKMIMSLHEAYVTPHYLVLVTEYCTGKELLYILTDRLNSRSFT